MKTNYVRRVSSANAAPSLETIAGPRVKRLLSVFASLVTLRRAGEHSSSSMAARSSSKLSGLSASSASTRRRSTIPARQASARAAWRRAKLFA